MANKTHSPGLLLRNAGIFNPVLVQAVGLCPVIAMATTLKGAALLAVVAATAITLCELIASMFLKVIPRWVRTGIYIIFGGAIVTPFMILIEKLNPELFGSLGIYLPVMAVNSLLVLRCERFAVKLSPVAALKDGFTASLGYAAVLLLVGTAREILGSGSIAGFKFWEGRTLSGLLLPFGGFLMLGFAAAALRTFISEYWPKFLDKKQPKPDAKKARPAKPSAKLPVPDLPDLTPEEDPFSLSEFADDCFPDEADYSFDLYSKEKDAAPAANEYSEIIIEEPEYIQQEPVRKILLNTSAADESTETAKTEESAFEEAEETAADIQGPEEEVAEEIPFGNETEPTDDEKNDEAAEEEEESDNSDSDEVDDDELEMLLNRSVDDIFKKPEEDKK